MTSKQSLKDHPMPFLQDRINWLQAELRTAINTREREHYQSELRTARAELKSRKKS